MPKKSNPAPLSEEEKRQLAYQEAELKAMDERLRTQAQEEAGLLIASGEFKAQDVERMIRANMMVDTDDWACQDQYRYSWTGSYRAVMHGRIPPAPAPIPFPRNTLLCPLHERLLLGDLDIPCFIQQEGLLDMEDDTPLVPIVRHEITPCRLLPTLILSNWPAILGLPPNIGDPAARPGKQELLRQRDSLLQAGPAHDDPERLRPQVRFLLDSGRLTQGGVDQLVESGLLVSDPEWLSCRDDPHRDRYAVTDEDLDSDEDLHYTRVHCEFHVRARLGDRTVPCAQALEAPVDLTSVPEDIQELYEVREIAKLPRCWDGKEDQPGGPRDPVRVLGIRPCHAFGRLFARDVHPYMERLAQDGAGFDVDVRSLKRRPETSGPEDVQDPLDPQAS